MFHKYVRMQRRAKAICNNYFFMKNGFSFVPVVILYIQNHETWFLERLQKSFWFFAFSFQRLFQDGALDCIAGDP